MTNDIYVDALGYACLAGVRTQLHTHYQGTERPDGTIILTPLVRVHAIREEPVPGDLVPAGRS